MRQLIFLACVVALGCGGGSSTTSTTGTTVAKPAKPAALTSVDGPNGALAVDDGGTGGIPVIFVHGLGGDRHVWDDTLAHLRPTRRAIAFDLHGFGKSALGTTYDVASHAADLDAVVRATGAPRVIVVGHSYGGFVVTEYAAKHADAVAGVVLVDPSGDFESLDAATQAQFNMMFHDHPEQAFGFMLQGAAPGVADRVLATFKTTDKNAFDKTFAAIMSYDPKPAVAAYTGPRVTMIAPFQVDFPVALHKVAKLEAKVIANASHWLFLDKPAEYLAVLDDFLARTN